MAVCRFFKAGKCTQGGKCKQEHPELMAQELRPAAPAFKPARRGIVVCRFYVESRCRNGPDCQFLHPGAVPQHHVYWIPGNGSSLGNDELERNYKGATIRFAAGARIIHLALPMDSDKEAIAKAQNQATAHLCTVACSWYNASKIIFLHYRSSTWASLAVKRFDSKYCGRQVNAVVQPPPKHHGKPQSIWSVRLSNIPASTTARDLRKHLTGAVPDRIVMGQPTSNENIEPEAARAILDRLLTQENRQIQSCNIVQSATGSRTKAFARFATPYYALDALALNGTKQPQLGSKLFIERVVTVMITILRPIYDVLEADIQTLSSTKKELESVQVSAHIQPKRNLVRIRIYGSNIAAVVLAAGTIGNYTSGQLVLDNLGHAIWNEWFETEAGQAAIRGLYHPPSNHYVHCDRRKRQLYSFSSDGEQHASLRTEIIQLLVSHIVYEMIELNDDLFERVLKSGIRQMVRRVGARKIKLDITCTPKVLSFHGSASEWDLCKAILDNPDVGKEPDLIKECPSCLCEAEDPVKLECAHVYCRVCFDRLCTEMLDADSVIKCFAEAEDSGDVCKHVVGLEELRNLSTHDALERVLERAVEAHLRSHSTEYSYCVTPDCNTIYRITSEPGAFSCPNCLNCICTRCQALSHHGMTCEEVRERNNNESLTAEQKKTLDIKECARCKAPFSKDEGCHHVPCRCGAHICYLCLDVFDKQVDCYEHLRMVHGRIFDLDPWEEQMQELDVIDAALRPRANGINGLRIPIDADVIREAHRLIADLARFHE